MRQFWVVVHRYIGLSIAIFLIIAGFTGSILVFYEELDAAINPELYRVTSTSAEAVPLDPLQIRERLLEKYPQAHINWITLKSYENQSLRISISPKSIVGNNTAYDLGFDEVFVDPFTGEILGTRTWGNISDGIENLIPFLFKLHYQLALDHFGTLLMGVVALLWTMDCFIGAYLTFPRKMRRRKDFQGNSCKKGLAGISSWFVRWKPAWLIRWSKGHFKLNYDLHNAGGLWVWAMLFVLAWSSVALNLHVVYQPVMAQMFDFQASRSAMVLDKPHYEPKLGYAEIRAVALEYLDKQGGQYPGGPIIQIEPTGMSYFPELGSYQYRFRSNRDINSEWGGTRLFIHGNTGDIRALYIPSGKSTGDTITTWLRNLHMASVWGMPFKIFVCVVGLIIMMLSITGVIIWWRKRAARNHSV